MSAKKEKRHITINIDSGAVVKTIAIVLIAIVFFSFLHQVAHALILIFIAFFLALALNPAVSWIANRLKSKSRVRATGLAYLMVLAFLITFFALVIPPLVRETVDFIKDVPQTVHNFTDEDSTFSRFIDRNHLNDQVNSLTQDFSDKFKDVREPVLSTAGAVGTAFISTITVLVLTFMMLVEGPSWFDKILEIQPKEKRAARKKLASKLYRTVTNYVNGQVIVAFIAGSFAFIALVVASNVFGVSVNAVALAAIIMLFGLLPLIGATIGAVIVVLAVLLKSVALAITMGIFFVIYQQVENLTIQPYIQSKTNSLTPLIVFIAALVGVSLGGILGAFIAIPTAGCIKIFVEDYFSNRIEAYK
ncbi:MAG TPA: AI-2E family transporter [Candidatus Saccharimonadales bacterium]|nr:AI-2E family transporter [Candidatus Saccharimonadales bacterium]